MSQHPGSPIKQISSVLVVAKDEPTLETTALCADGSVWTITRIPSTGTFVEPGWQQYPSIPQQGVSNAESL
jgi:hypothetical protein